MTQHFTPNHLGASPIAIDVDNFTTDTALTWTGSEISGAVPVWIDVGEPAFGATWDAASDIAYHVRDDRVYLAGTAVNESGQSTVTILTLPAAARPVAKERALIYDDTNDAAVQVEIDTDGTVDLSVAPSGDEVYYVNISFPITNALA